MIRAAGLGPLGGWVLSPPVSQNEAATEFGADIPDSAWREIKEAFAQHGKRLDELKGTRSNQNRNDKQGWLKRKNDTEKQIKAAEEALCKINRDFLCEAEDNISLIKSGWTSSYNCVDRLNNALNEIEKLACMVRDAEPRVREIPTESKSRQMLARDVFKALKPHGADLSNGWKLGQSEARYTDLTGFERLAELLGIHLGCTPKATAKWLRDALAQDK